MEEKHPIIGMVVRGPRKHPELGRCEFWIVVSNSKGIGKSFYYQHNYNDTSKNTPLIKFIKKIAKYAGVGVEHKDIEELIYIMRCTISEDPI